MSGPLAASADRPATWRDLRLANLTGWVAALLLGLGSVFLQGPARPWAAIVVALGCVAVVGGLPSRRLPRREAQPWLLFGAAGVLILIGHAGVVLRGEEIGGRPNPFWVEAVYLVGYGLVVAGQVVLGRRRRSGADGDHLFGPLLVALNATAVVAVIVVLPVVRRDDPIGGVVVAASTMMGLVIVAGAAALTLGPGARARSWYLLLAGWAGLLAIDLWPVGSRLPVFVACLPFVLMAAAAAHPSMRLIAQPGAPREVQLTERRLALLCLAMAAPLGLLVAAVLTDRHEAVVVLAIASTVDGALVLSQLVALVRSKERIARQAETLRHLATDLLTAADGSAIERSATAAACRLVGPGATAVVLPPLEAPESRSSDDRRTVLPLRAPQGPLGALVITSPGPVPHETGRALAQLTDQVSLALGGAKMGEEVRRRGSERRFRAFIDHSSDLVAVVGLDGTFSFASPAAERLLLLRAELVVGLNPLRLVHDDDRQLAKGLFDAAWAGAEVQDPVEVRLQRLDGSWRWFEIAASAVQADGATSLLLNVRDVDDRKQAGSTLAEREARFSALVRHATDLVLVLGDGGHIRWASPSSSRLLGVADGDLVGIPFSELVHVDDHPHLGQLIGSVREGPFELRLRHATTGWRVIALTATDLRHVSAVQGIVLNAHDVTEAKSLEGELRHRAHHDGLTKLPNRVLFAERVERALAQSTQIEGHVAVLFIDLDDFKTVNDGLGHAVGDVVLGVAASRVKEAATAAGTPARLGGDEFAVLLEGPDAPRLAGQVGRELVASLSRPMPTEAGPPVQLSASIGIATNDIAGHTVKDLLRAADVAMYLAKTKGKGRVERYEDGMNDAVLNRLEMKQDLVRAMADGTQISVVFQPVVELATGQITAVEALLRWQHPTSGAIAPAAFIPLAEDTGQIHSLGLYVLDQACRHLHRWIDAGYDLAVHVNVSARQLEDETFVASFTQTINRYGLPAGKVVLELTESVAASPAHRATLDQLHGHGVRIAIDDFGTGYASWGYLADLPVEVLKLDRSFVSCIGSEQTLEVVRAIIGVARANAVVVVAEGVERAEERVVLAGLGCQQGQGLLFGQPLPADQLTRYLGPPSSGQEGPGPGGARMSAR